MSLLEAIKREYKGSPKTVLMEMMDIISQYGRNNYRRSWEMLIEFLGRYLGLMTDPWVYSDPRRDLRRVIDRTNPRRISGFQLEWEGRVGASKMIIHNPAKPHPYIFYFAHNYVTQWVSKSKKLEGEEKKLYDQLMQKGLLERYVKAARNDPWDHLGQVFEELELAGRKNRLGQILTPRNIIEFMVQSAIGTDISKHNPNEPLTDLDPTTGTGRFLIVATLMFPEKPLILFGIEIDLTLYRACLVNMALFSNHPYSIICADAFMMVSEDRSAWEQGNLWNPPDMTPYYWYGCREPTPHHSLSFAELMEIKRKRLLAEKELNIKSEEQPIIVKTAAKHVTFFENYVKAKSKK